MSLKPGMRVLDVGCGVGGPARQIATFADVNVVGLNNNPFQVGRARRYTQQMGLEKQVQFVTGDFMKLTEQFGENAFDAGKGHFDLRKEVCSSLAQCMQLRRRFMRQHGRACTEKYSRF